jgi:hypothetical protein
VILAISALLVAEITGVSHLSWPCWIFYKTRAHYAAQADLKLTTLTSASQALVLQARTAIVGFELSLLSGFVGI